jgi:flagellar operon protein
VSAVVPTGPLLAPGLGIAPAGAPPKVAPAQHPAGASAPATGPSFADVLAERTAAMQAPRFSRHALDRLRQRGIELGPQTIARLTSGLAQAKAKGSRDSVVFVDGTAFVASVTNNTVITAVGSEHMREHVFTNIDSAVIA